MTNPSPSWLRAAGRHLAALWWLKLPGITLGMVLFFVAYFYLLHHPIRPPIVMPLTPVDHWVGFTPLALPLYLSLWVYVSLAPGLAANGGQLRSWFLAAFALSMTGLGLFYACPTAVPPFDIVWAQDSTFAFLKNTDASGNACPSLHVAFAVLTAGVIARRLRELGAGPVARSGNLLWCVGIVWSTLATRQHVFLDAAAGAGLGAAFGPAFLRGGPVSAAAPPSE
jgi:membrane-associated phospholipid phosphatase